MSKTKKIAFPKYYAQAAGYSSLAIRALWRLNLAWIGFCIMNNRNWYKLIVVVLMERGEGEEGCVCDAALFGGTLLKKKNSCEKWCPKFKATSIRIHFSAWWIIEQQPEQPWVLALFCDGFCMNKTLFGLQSCLRCRDTALCSNMEIALGTFSLRLPLLVQCSLPPAYLILSDFLTHCLKTSIWLTAFHSLLLLSHYTCIIFSLLESAFVKELQWMSCLLVSQ